MKKFCLIGRDISKSLSPSLHKLFGEYFNIPLKYDLFDIDIDNFDVTLSKILNEYDGFNVTAPYKMEVARVLSSELATVNTVKTQPFNTYNTDGIGLIKAFNHFNVKVKGSRVLIVGCGGAAARIAPLLVDGGAIVELTNRTFSKAVRLANQCNCIAVEDPRGKYDIVLSLTPSCQLMIDKQILLQTSIAFDAVYSVLTEFSAVAKSNSNCKYISGLYMLFFQGLYAFEIWNDIKVTDEDANVLLNKFIEGI